MSGNTSVSLHNIGNDQYLAIDSILACNERITCKLPELERKTYHQLLQCSHLLGILNSSLDSEELPAGTKLDLPFWIARELHRQKLCQLEVPKPYKETYREILEADATTVDFSKLSSYYYKSGLLLLEFAFPESEDISKSLIQAFQQRLRKIIDVSQNPLKGCSENKFTSKLDRDEKYLFHNSQMSLQDFQNWQSRKTTKITTAEVISNHKKRKRV